MVPNQDQGQFKTGQPGMDVVEGATEKEAVISRQGSVLGGRELLQRWIRTHSGRATSMRRSRTLFPVGPVMIRSPSCSKNR